MNSLVFDFFLMTKNREKLQLHTTAKIAAIKTKFTKTNKTRRTLELTNSLLISLEDLWLDFTINFDANADPKVFSDVEQIYLATNSALLKNRNKIVFPYSAIDQKSPSESENDSDSDDFLDSSPNIKNTDLKSNIEMAPNTKDILKAVNTIIPVFEGGIGKTIQSEISNFITCCKAVEKMFEKDDDFKYFISIIKIRLRGEAFELVSQMPFDDIDKLEVILKDSYIPKAGYSDINMNLVKARQLQRENIFDFGKRVTMLLSKCKTAIKTKHAKNDAVISSLIEEEELLAAKCFRNGLTNQRIQVRLSCCDIDKLSVAIEKAVCF